jgi:HAD superfamily hydrolase (TIGR01509 family)
LAPYFDLVIFDCDGVLVDSEPIANRVLADHLRTVGVSMPEEEVMRKFVGRTRDGCLTLAAELLGHALPADFAAKWDASLFDALRSEVKAIDGVVELIQSLRIPFCVASNGTRDRLHLTLEAAGLLALFEGRIFCAADVARPKPAPDLFLHAAKSMGVAPARSAVVEDTPTGARAGKAAGMSVFGFAGGISSTREALEAEGAKVFGEMTTLATLIGARP